MCADEKKASPDGEAVEERSDETDEEITQRHGYTLSPHPSPTATPSPSGEGSDRRPCAGRSATSGTS